MGLLHNILILQNKFNLNQVELIDHAIKGMVLANAMEDHADQRGCFGGFSNALTSLFKEVYGDRVGEEIYNRYQFELYSGDEFMKWFDEIVAEDVRTAAESMETSAVTIQEVQ